MKEVLPVGTVAEFTGRYGETAMVTVRGYRSDGLAVVEFHEHAGHPAYTGWALPEWLRALAPEK